MTMTATLKSTWTEDALLNWLGDNTAVDYAWRRAQLSYFIEHGFPDRSNEQWKYSDLSFLKKQVYDQPQPSDDTVNITPYKLTNSISIVFENGQFNPSLSTIDCDQPGVIITAVSQLPPDHKSRYIDSKIAAQWPDSAVTALNGALAAEGVFISIPNNCMVTKKIHILHLNTHQKTAYMHHLRHIIQVGVNATVDVVEEYVGVNNGSYLSTIVTHVALNRASHLNYYKIQQESSLAHHLATVKIDQQQDSHCDCYYAGSAAAFARDDLICNMTAAGASSSLTGFYSVKAKQHYDMHVYADHRETHTTSNQHYKGLLADQSTGIFNGKIHIHPDASHSQAQMLNNNLLHDQGVTVYSKPELEIYTDEVKCAHGSTIGQMDDDALFYMRSRGLEESVAQELLAQAFLQEAIDKFPCDEIKEKISSYLQY